MSVFKSFSLMSILTFLSRILGYARDLLFAFIFGASSSADSFLLAFRLPNLFRRLFAEGAISNALIPLYLDIKKKSNKKIAQTFYNSVFNYLIIILLIVTVLAEIFMKEIISFLADYVGRSSEVTYIVNQLMTKASVQVETLGQHLKTLNN